MRNIKSKCRYSPLLLCLIVIAFVTLTPQHLVAQENKGFPFITNYRYQDYNGSGINWWAVEDDNGMMYFANERGILVYDGNNWEIVKPQYSNSIRSMVKGKDGKIYIGTNDDIGYIDPKQPGNLKYVSLKDQIPAEYRVFEEVWQTDIFNDKIYFLTSNKIFVWDYKTFKVLESKEGFHMAGIINGKYYVRIWEKGLTVLENDKFIVVPNGEKFASERIYVLLPYSKSEILIGSRTQGLFIYDGKNFRPFKTEADAYITNTSLYGGLILSNGLIALNTFNDGMVIINHQGKLIQRIDKSVGLQDNSVDHLYEDSRGILWMSLFNGISKMDINSSLTYYGEASGLPSKTVFSLGLNNGILYAGTNNGIYALNNRTNHFEFVEGTGGQTGDFIKNGDDYLVCSGERGLLKLMGTRSVPAIASTNYNFHIRNILRSPTDSTLFFASLRFGLAAVRYNTATKKYAVEAYGEGLTTGIGQFEVTKKGNVWIGGKVPGEVRLVQPAIIDGKVNIEKGTVTEYGADAGLPSKFVSIGMYDGVLNFITDIDSVFAFDEATNRFVLDTSTNYLNKYAAEQSIGSNTIVDYKGRIWANFGKGIFVKIPTKDSSIKIIDAPFRELRKNYPVWNILTPTQKDDKDVYWFAGPEGIIRYEGDLEETAGGGNFKTVIRGIKLNEDSVYFSGLTIPETKSSFSHKWNSVRIDYAAPYFKLENETLFSTFLEGRDDDWSEWSKQSFREFGNLSPGKYTFKVKAKNIYDEESTETSYTFSVLPPWYSTWWAWLIYALLALGLIYVIVRWRTRQLQKKHKELEKIVEARTGELKQKADELAVINNVQEGLVKEMDIKAIYHLVGNKICELFDTQTVLIRTFDHDSDMEHWQFAIEKGKMFESEPRPLIWANKEMIRTKKPLLINENYLETSVKHGGSGVSKGLPPKSALFVPMVVGNIVKGSVSLQNVEKENAFTDSDLRLLTTLTNSMSVALENARLFDESNILLADAKQRANELSTVNNISQALTSQLNLTDLINLVGEQMKQLFNANIVYLALLDKETNIINFPYQSGDNMAPMKLGEGLTSSIIKSGEPLLINKDVQELSVQMGVSQVGIPAASYLGVPIPVGDEVIGVLSVQSTEHENRFNEDDKRLLTTIAASVGIAIRKTKLFEEVQVAKFEAEAARKTAEKANDAKSAFLSTVSHELRTPLTSVLGFAKIIKKRLEDKIFPITDRSDPKTEKTITQITENLDVVVSEGERLTHLINDVLDLAKIEAGKMEWNMEPLSISEVAERAIAATSALFLNDKITLEKNIQASIPEIAGDRDKLIQVIVNLISNAVKFTPEGKVGLSVKEVDKEIVVSITDTGIGIAPEDHAAVFEQFKQVGDTLTDKPKGTGLGLPICKEIIEHHGGRLWLDSELGKGSTFSFALPITKATGTSKPMHIEDLVKQLKEQVAYSQLSMKDKAARLLIVDDDDSIRSLLNQELTEAGYIIEEARNGKEALNCVRDNRPDLIILDIMMPEMNGFDVAAVLKNDPQTMDIPIIVLSIVQDKTRGFRIGVDRYLTKPIDTNLLFNEIGSLLEQGKSKKKVMIVDEDTGAINTLTDVLKAKGYTVLESDGKELVEKAVTNKPDIIIINSLLSGNQDIVKTLRFEKGMENVLFLVYQ
ncbi:MAG: response regulator [Chitinophagaceae bacterium]|nr:response regulator [Chitinophagaceae bacterium]